MESQGRIQLQGMFMKGCDMVHLKNIQVHLPAGPSVYILMSELIYSAGTSLIQLVITKISISRFRKCASGAISASYYTTPRNAGAPRP